MCVQRDTIIMQIHFSYHTASKFKVRILIGNKINLEGKKSET